MKVKRICSFLCVALLMAGISGGCAARQAPAVQKGDASDQNLPVEGVSDKRPIKTIGIIGGVSWASSIEYYRLMNEMVRDRLGGVHSAQILLFSIEFGEFSKQERMADKGDWTLMTQTILDAAHRLKQGGADFIVVASNTLNSLAVPIEHEVGLPVLHIAEATGKEINDKGVKTVALLGTKYTMEQHFYREHLEKHGIKVVIPNMEEREFINTVIFDELCANMVKKESKDGFTKIIARLQEEENVEGVILGCTEIPLLVKQEDVPIPVFNTTEIHAAAAVEYALSR